jgi:hypothetical protein
MTVGPIDSLVAEFLRRALADHALGVSDDSLPCCISRRLRVEAVRAAIVAEHKSG